MASVMIKTLVVKIFLSLSVMYCSCHKQGDGCYSPWKRIGSGCYLFRQQKVSPDIAFALCSHYDAYLANLETLDEALLIQYEIRQMNAGISYIVGGRNINRYRPGGDWRWIQRGNMTKMSYYAFGKGEPSGNNSSPEDCIIMHISDSYYWHDVHCARQFGGYICEKKIK